MSEPQSNGRNTAYRKARKFVLSPRAFLRDMIANASGARNEVNELSENLHDTRQQLAALRAELVESRLALEAEAESSGQTIAKLQEQLRVSQTDLAEAKKKAKEQKSWANESARRAATFESAQNAALMALRQNSSASIEIAIEALAPDNPSVAERRVAQLAGLDSPEDLASQIRTQRTFSFEQAFRLGAGRGPVGGTIVLNDTRTQNNVGCRATTMALLQGFERVGAPVVGTVTLSELREIWRVLRHLVGKDAGAHNLDEYIEVFGSHPALGAYRDFLGAADRIVTNGEGSFYDRQTKGLALCVMALWAIRDRSIPLAFVNLSASLTDEVMSAWSLQAFAASRGVWLREKRSLEFVRQALPPERVQVATDAAFAYADEPPRPLDHWNWQGLHPDEPIWSLPQKPYVVITGTSSLFRGDREPSAPWPGLRSLISELASAGWNAVLYCADTPDGLLLRDAAVSLGCPLVSAATPVSVVRSLLYGAECMISGRWHASILAATVGTPTVLGDANFYKTEALNELLGLGAAMFDYRRLADSVPQIVAAVQMLARPGQREALLNRSRAESNLFREAVSEVIQATTPA